MMLAQGDSVQIVARATNRVVAMLSDAYTPEEHRHHAPITGMALSPDNPLQLLTCSLDGSVKVWDYLESALHDSVDVGHPLVAMDVCPRWKGRVFLAARKAGKESEKESSTAVLYALQLGKRAAAATHRPGKLVRLGKAKHVSQLAVSPDGAWLVALGRRKVLVLALHDQASGLVKYPTESTPTALAFHPDAHVPRFATGEANGKIRIWYCLEQLAALGRPASTEGRAQPGAATTTLHWHAHAVAALRYTPDGAQLISGGEEGVLVLWKLNSGNAAGTEGREFVPRLGAGITAVCVAHAHEGREQEYVARLADGAVVFVAALSLKPVRTFATVKSDATRALLPPRARGALPNPLALDPAAGLAVLTSGHPSTLQFVDVATGAHVRDLEVVPSNRVSRPEGEALDPPRVLMVALSAPARGGTQAQWMATLDGREGGAFSGELSLKLWHWDARQKTYVLNTRIDQPHERTLTSMAFSPPLAQDETDAFMLVTGGRDGHVKTWRMATRALKGARTELYWTCRSSLAYRDTQPRHVAWAPDGSLFAVAQGVFVTLWDPHTLVMLALLPCAELREVRSCAFVGRRGRFLSALGSHGRVLLWDLVSQGVVGAAEHVTAHLPFRDGVLLATAQKGRMVLRHVRPAGAALVREYVADVAVHAPLLDASCVRRGADADAPPYLLGFTDDGALVALGEGETQALARSLRGVQLGDARATLFDDLFGYDAQTEERLAEALEADRRHAAEAQSGVAGVLELFATPSHLLPPMTSLLDPFMDALLPPVAAPTAPAPAPAPDADGAEVEEASDEELPAAAPRPLPASGEQDRVSLASVADFSYLTDAFARVMSTGEGAADTAGEKPPSKGRRRTSRTIS